MRKLLRFLPDSVYISLVYFKHFGRFPNLKNPKTYNEKLQWLKLHDRREEYTLMVDKHLVKQYVADKVGEQHIIPTLGVWERAEDIDFDALPEKFVLKWNHDSGSVVICKDKSGFDRAAAVARLKKFEDHNGFWYGREWPYKNVKPCIIAEQFVEDVDELIEYKLFCFDGKVKMILSRKGNPVSGKYTNDYCDTELKRLPFTALHPNSEGEVYVPEQLPELIAFAETLSAGLRHVRVDTYIADEQIYFGELTFFNNSGFCPFEPSEWDEIVGQWLVLPQKEKELE